MKIRFHIAFMILLSGSILLSEGCKLFKKKEKTADYIGNSNSINFDDYFIDACTHFNNGNYSLSIKNLEKCLNIKPDEASVYYQLSKNYFELSNTNLSLQNAMKAYNLAPDNIYYDLWYAEKLSLIGNLSEAIKVLEKSVAKHTKDEELLKALDAVYVKNANPIQDRINLWSKYRSDAGFKLTTSIKLIGFYKQIKDYGSAHVLYDEIKKASPLKYQYFVEDANLYLLQNDEIHANENFEKAILLNPNNFNLNYSLFKLKADKKEFEAAINYLNHAFSDPITNLDTKLGVCSQINQKLKEDSSYLQYTYNIASQLLKNYPDNSKSLFVAASYFEQNGKFEDALNAYSKINDISPGMFDAWMGSIKMANKLSQFKTAIDLANKALEYYPNVAQIYLEAARSSCKIKEFSQAIEFSKSGLSFAFDPIIKSNLLFEQGIAFFKLNQFKEAEKVLLESIKLNENDAFVYEYLGNVYSKLNQAEKAVEYWKKAQSLGIKTLILEKKIKDEKYFE